MIGKTLGHFRILDRIGAGGMGEVYRAHDPHLDRDVALKVLPTSDVSDDGARRRFRKEALALAKLKHPHIGVVHDFGAEDGVDYLVMELIQGDDLSTKLKTGPLPESDVVRFGMQIAEALEEAHENQIVHRDLKPQNVMVTHKNQAKVLDFGLAMLVRPLHDATTASMTEAQSIAGTLPYMAPEQLCEGADIDARTDVYALGATLYEMAVGRRAFAQSDHAQLITAILNDAPPSPRTMRADLDEHLERVIMRALQKDPEKRYASAHEMREDLQRVQAGLPVEALPAPGRLRRTFARAAASVGLVLIALIALDVGGMRAWFGIGPKTIASIAVLPFQDFSEAAGQDEMADYATYSLINKLGGLGFDKVPTFRSVRGYRNNATVSLGEIGDQLGVQAVIEGSLVRRGDQVQLTASLIDPQSERHLWTQEYTHDVADWDGLLNQVAREVTTEIGLTLTETMQQRLDVSRRVDPAALELYARGFAKLSEGTEATLHEAISLFEQAVQIDPDYAPAHAGIAEAWMILAAPGAEYVPWRDAAAKAYPAVTKALALDPNLGDAYRVLAGLGDGEGWDAENARKQLLKAIELNPSDARSINLLAQNMNKYGQHEEALKKQQRAAALDPNNPWIEPNVIWRRMFLDPQKAVAEGHRLVEKVDNWLAWWSLGFAQIIAGSYDEAIATLEEASVKFAEDENSQILGTLARAYARAGRRDEALGIVEKYERGTGRAPSGLIGMVYADLGDYDQAFHWFERGYDEHSGWIPWIPLFLADDEGLQADPRYAEFVQRLGLPKD